MPKPDGQPVDGQPHLAGQGGGVGEELIEGDTVEAGGKYAPQDEK